eukprot:1011483_1
MKSAIGLCLPLCCLLIVCFQFHTSVLGANDKGIYSKEIRKKYSIGYDSIDSVEIQKTNNVYGDSSDATEIQNKNKCTFCKMESAMLRAKAVIKQDIVVKNVKNFIGNFRNGVRLSRVVEMITKVSAGKPTHPLVCSDTTGIQHTPVQN